MVAAFTCTESKNWQTGTTVDTGIPTCYCSDFGSNCRLSVRTGSKPMKRTIILNSFLLPWEGVVVAMYGCKLGM
eukprot:3296759-Amphidinium_carterae.1